MWCRFSRTPHVATVWLSVYDCLSFFLCLLPSVCLFSSLFSVVRPSFGLSICLYVYLSTCIFISVCLSICQAISSSVCLSVCLLLLPIDLCNCLFILLFFIIILCIYISLTVLIYFQCALPIVCLPPRVACPLTPR